MSIFSTFLDIFFSLLYNQFSRQYDWVAAFVSVGRWNHWVNAVIPDLGGSRILELGYGPGHLQLNLTRNGLNVIGIDVSPGMGRLAYHRIVESGFSPNLLRGLGQQLPFPSDTFDQVVSTFPSRYIFDTTTLSGIYRVLLPGGKLVVLPVAWIDRERVLDRLAAGIFNFTRQAPKWEATLADPFIAAGFQLKIDQRRLASSEVLIIIATKST